MFDVIIVGSGATGGWAAKTLTERGLRVAMLEAGSRVKRSNEPLAPDYYVRKPTGAAPVDPGLLQRQPIQSRHYTYHRETQSIFVDDLDNPYSGSDRFSWIRARRVGGRSLVWGGQCWQLSDHELRGVVVDGRRHSWPLSWSDLASHYAVVEQQLDVRGDPEDRVAHLPCSRIGVAPVPLTPAEVKLRDVIRATWPERSMVRIRAVSRDVSKRPFQDEQPWPVFSSPGSSLADAAATGRLELISDAVVSRVIAQQGREVVTLEYIDAVRELRGQLTGRALVLCASTIESVRLLLSSASPLHPGGIGNHSGLLGRGLMDHCTVEVPATLPAEWQRPDPVPVWWNGDGLYLPRYRNLDGDEAAFQGGYGVMMSAQRHDAIDRESGEGGRAWMMAYGEVLPYPDNRITLHPDGRDRWGIPTVHVELSYRANEAALLDDAAASITAMFTACGCVPGAPQRYSAGLSVHEVGGAAMGESPEASVTDRWGRIWTAPNIVVADGATWPTSAYQNPTLTMMALARRAATRLADDLGARSS